MLKPALLEQKRLNTVRIIRSMQADSHLLIPDSMQEVLYVTVYIRNLARDTRKLYEYENIKIRSKKFS